MSGTRLVRGVQLSVSSVQSRKRVAMPNFDQAKREAAKKELHTLFKGVASNKVASELLCFSRICGCGSPDPRILKHAANDEQKLLTLPKRDST